jgi:hypothetical protein
MKKTFLLFVAASFPLINLLSQQAIIIKDAWARPGAKNANSAVYFVIQNNSSKADTILGAKSKRAEIVEIHESFKRDNESMGMRQVKFVSVAANSKLKFEPGGFHVMLIGLMQDLIIGNSFDVTINFKHAGKIKVKAVVREINN